MIPEAPIEKESGTILPTSGEKDAAVTLAVPTNPEKKSTQTPDRPATSNRQCGHSDAHNEYGKTMNFFLVWLGLGWNCNSMLENEMKMLAQHDRTIGCKVVCIILYAVREDPELNMKAQAQIIAAIYLMHAVII